MKSRHQFERAAAALQPFRVAIDKVQRDDATLFSCLAIWERLLRTVDERLKDVVTKRFHFMLREPYLLLSFFSPTTNTIKHGFLLEDKVRQALLQYDAGAAAELDTWTNLSHKLRVTPLTSAEYLDYITSNVRPRCPRIARLI